MEAPVELELPGINGRKGWFPVLESLQCQAPAQKWSRVMLSPGAETKKRVQLEHENPKRSKKYINATAS